jgi:hypothetical protein
LLITRITIFAPRNMQGNNNNRERFEFPWSSILYFTLLLGLTVYYMNDYDACRWPIGYMRVILLGISLVCRLILVLPDQHVITKTLLILLSGICFLAWTSVAMFFYIDNLLINDMCIELMTTITDGVLIGIVGIFIILIFGGMIVFMVAECHQKMKKNQFAKELKEVYKKIHKKGFSIDKFIEKYQNDIDSVPLVKEEHAILKDMYTCKYDESKVYKEEVCCICVSDLKGDELLMEFPHCAHTTHFDCLMGWFKEKMECPMCRGKIRESLLRGVTAKAQEKYKEKPATQKEETRGTRKSKRKTQTFDAVDDATVNIEGGRL